MKGLMSSKSEDVVGVTGGKKGKGRSKKGRLAEILFCIQKGRAQSS